jgi:molybdate transport system substrate-binding protein
VRAAALVLLAGCGGGRPGSGESRLMISAAASLRDAATTIARDFQARHPHARPQLNFASSGSLRRQIEHGAPVDVFLAASPDDVDALVRSGSVASADRRVFAKNRLVLVGAQVRALSDLGSAAVRRVGIGNPRSVPAGRYARAWLSAEGLWDAVQPKLVLGEDVRQVTGYVGRGEVDAALVYATDARVAGLDPVVVAAEQVPEILYEAALVRSPGRRRNAGRFLEYLLSEPARRVLHDAGFLPP